MDAQGPAGRAVVVGSARIYGEVWIDPRPVDRVSVRRGETLRLQVPYAFRESSRRREGYSFRLRSQRRRTLHDATPDAGPSVAVRERDHWGRNDVGEGVLEQPYKFDEAGEFRIEFEVEADYVRTPWRSAQVELFDRKKRNGHVCVTVEPQSD